MGGLFIMGFINKQTFECDVKNCHEQFSITQNIPFEEKPSFVVLPPDWKNFICHCSNFYICPRHEIEIKIDGEILG